MAKQRYVATVARALEGLLSDELTKLGIKEIKAKKGAVSFIGNRRDAYLACIGSRVASRVLFPIAEFEMRGHEDLYEACRAIPWEDHLGPKHTLRVHAAVANNTGAHSRYLSQRLKDSIVDRFRDLQGFRPSVDRHHPDVPIYMYWDGTRAEISIELTTHPLHQRGYRSKSATAPLRETLAAALLYLAEWPKRAAEGAALVDLMCGSGTLLIEAAWMAQGRAPGLHHKIGAWLGHDVDLWREVIEEFKAAQRRSDARIFGYDASESALKGARESIRLAEVEDYVVLDRRALRLTQRPSHSGPLVVVTNPPYGERLGAEGELLTLYESLGDVLKRQFYGCDTFVLSSNRRLAGRIGLRAKQRVELYNGPIECRFYHYEVSASVPLSESPQWRKPRPEALMFANRLKKNLAKQDPWARQQGIDAYRIYDADIPEYKVAIDRYADLLLIQEYEQSGSIPPETTLARLNDVRLVAMDLCEAKPEDVIIKVRKRHTQGTQYETDGSEEFVRVLNEKGLRVEVRLGPRLDTGLFPDHRKVRAMISKLAQNKRVLNLFAYTCTASLAAVKGGAASVNSVDLSKSYLEWGKRNFAHNQLAEAKAEFTHADVRKWLARSKDLYDLIFVNPPTYSRSKQMRQDFDVKRDHTSLLESCMRRLADKGVLVFSTHARNFELDRALAKSYQVSEISRHTVPRDYLKSPHRAWRIQR